MEFAKLSKHQQESLLNVINRGVSKGAEVMNTLLQAVVELHVPYLTLVEPAKIYSYLDGPGEYYSAINMQYLGDMNGSVQLIFARDSAFKLISSVLPDEIETGTNPMDERMSGALCEVGNILVNAVIGTISNILGMSLNYSVPEYVEGNIKEMMSSIDFGSHGMILAAKTQFSVQDLNIFGDLLLFFSVSSFTKLLDKIREQNEIEG
jgi:chemotaxis protein CheC